MRTFFFTLTLSLATLAGAAELPYDREIINRNSLDGLPRSLSIRQGEDRWLGYDLERAKVFKAWQSPAGKPGLVQSGFVTKSAGKAKFSDPSAETWRLQRAGKEVPLSIRYLGCSQREKGFDLNWELRHETGTIQLQQRVPVSGLADEGWQLEIRAEGLAAEETLLLPSPAQEAWKLTFTSGKAATALRGSEWHRLTLP